LLASVRRFLLGRLFYFIFAANHQRHLILGRIHTKSRRRKPQKYPMSWLIISLQKHWPSNTYRTRERVLSVNVGDCRMEAGTPVSRDMTLSRYHNQHRTTVPTLCWHASSSPCQPAAAFIKQEVMQLPSNGVVDDNRSSDDSSWTYVSPSNVCTINYYARDNRTWRCLWT